MLPSGNKTTPREAPGHINPSRGPLRRARDQGLVVVVVAGAAAVVVVGGGGGNERWSVIVRLAVWLLAPSAVSA